MRGVFFAGDRVAVYHRRGCGKCHRCRRGNLGACHHRRSHGADTAVDTAGSAPAHQAMVAALGYRGRASVVGFGSVGPSGSGKIVFVWD
jgi:threonine dehydrogenase-like Zn-dependent dehydrogenase